jgi:glycosyltransferase involved in cell wall biosynthesis
VALIAPVSSAVPVSGLGGLDQVRWLAEGLSQRGHQVTLIGSDLGGLTGADYTVIDTDPAGGHHVSPEVAERWHAEQARKVLESLGGVDVDLVSDHTHTGWLPPDGTCVEVRTVQTCYQPTVGDSRLVDRPGHLGWVAISVHQQHRSPNTAWAGVIHPAIPVGEHQLSFEHTGPCVYLSPLRGNHGPRLALEAAHQAGWPMVLAGTTPSEQATAYAAAELRPALGQEDELLLGLTTLERWELLAKASCLVAPLASYVPYSLEIVEAMTYGTPVVTTVGTVGAELVSHGLSGVVVDDRAALPEAIVRSARLNPRRVRDWASSRYDLRGMVSAYEWLLSRLAVRGSP